MGEIDVNLCLTRQIDEGEIAIRYNEVKRLVFVDL